MRIVEQFHRIDFLLTEERFEQLIESKAHFDEIHLITSVLQNTFILLSKKICKKLLEEKDYCRDFAFGIQQLQEVAYPMQSKMNQFLVQMAEAGNLAEAIGIITQLVLADYFTLQENTPLFLANQRYIAEIGSAIDFLHKDGVPVTRKFCELLIALIKDLHPLTKEELHFLAANAKYSSQIQTAVASLKEAGFPIPRDILLFLVSEGKNANEIQRCCVRMKMAIESAKRARIRLELHDFILLLKNAKNSWDISQLIDFLYDKDVPLEREDFKLIIENGAKAQEIKFAIRRCRRQNIRITRDVFLSILGQLHEG